jgi:release factor glutamine methyltransferase
MLLSDFIHKGTRSLESLYPSREAHNIVLMLCESLLGVQGYTHIVEPETVVDPAREPELLAALDRLSSGEPVQYVLGFADFCGFRFKVTPDVLIPRPETEQLVREAVKEAARLQRQRSPYGRHAAPVRVLDLCTGSGCIAWSVALSVPGTEVVAVDISEPALAIARSQDFSRECKDLKAKAPQFLCADILDTEQSFEYGTFDLILSNPPYILESEKVRMHRNVLEHEPYAALFVPDADPLVFYRAIAVWSQRLLGEEGKGMAEINETRGKETEAVFREAGFRSTSLVKDIFERNRFVLYSKNND